MTQTNILETYETNILQPETERTLALRPSMSSMVDEFREVINNRILEKNPKLPSFPSIETINVIDRDAIIELNNITASERRLEFMSEVITRQNPRENILLLIENCNNQTREYINDLIITSSINIEIPDEWLYEIGNIYLYTAANLEADHLVITHIMETISESMTLYNTNQIFSLLLNTHITSYNDYLYNVGLASENQIEQRVQEFYQEVDQRISLNRRRLLYTGVGLLGTMALSSLGMPPVGGLLIRALTQSDTNYSGEEIVRLRDVWDFSLKKLLSIIKKY